MCSSCTKGAGREFQGCVRPSPFWYSFYSIKRPPSLVLIEIEVLLPRKIETLLLPLLEVPLQIEIVTS